jgi:pectate lyase
MIMNRSCYCTLLTIMFAAGCGGTGAGTAGGRDGGAASSGTAGGSVATAGSDGQSDAAQSGAAGASAGAIAGANGGITRSGGTAGSSGGVTGSSGGTFENSDGTAASSGTTANSGGAMGNSGGIVASGGAAGSSGGTITSGGTTSGGGKVMSGGTTSSGGSSVLAGSAGGTKGSGAGGTGGARDAGAAGAGGNRDAGSPSTGGAAGATSGNCTTPPAPSPLIGWATASGSTTGGGNATPIMVTTLAALQSAVKSTTPAVIYVKGVLEAGSLTMGSNKTIVGLCGAQIHGHIGINKQTNIIIRNIKIVGYAVGNCALDPSYSSATGCSSGDDAITVQGQSDHLWFDHDDISDGTDGNLDITHACDFITVSWTKFHYSSARTDNTGSDSTGANGHRFSNLVGHSDSNASEDTGHLTITWHHNWWGDFVVERQPRVRFGRVHLFNNLYTSTVDNYCIGVGVGANLRTENNVFVGVKTPIDTSDYSDATSAIRSTGNAYPAGAAPADLNASSVFDPASSYTYAVDDTAGLQATIESGAGPK